MKDLGRAPHLLASVACGGKLPSMGDFVWSTPDPELRGPLDAWLQTGMHQFRLAYVDQWQAMFDNAPLWNFIVPAGGLSKDCIIGCLSPSCDRVGRRFPFVVAFPLPSRMAPWQMTSVVNSTPVLLSRVGLLLFNCIRRRWPMETLVSLIQQSFVDWHTSQSNAHGHLDIETGDSDILTVLMDGSIDTDKAATLPNDRFASLPWSDVASNLCAPAAMSFWWTNGAGNASLKAFTYSAHPDGTLLAWLFGRPSN